MSAFISTLNQIPVINADVVTGFSICVLLVVALHISKDSYIPLVAGHVTLCAPFVFLSVMPRIQQMDSSIYEAALDLGATPFKALTQVLLPSSVTLSVKRSFVISTATGFVSPGVLILTTTAKVCPFFRRTGASRSTV